MERLLKETSENCQDEDILSKIILEGEKAANIPKMQKDTSSIVIEGIEGDGSKLIEDLEN